MAEQSVIAADGRKWTLRSQLEWRAPATAEDFEHDVTGGQVSAAIMISLVVIFAAVLFLWMPDAVVVPSWVVLLLALIILFFPTRWALRRPWRVVAETVENDEDAEPERWVGTVRGVFKVQGELKRIKTAIEEHSMPDINGPLRPVE
ncbi:MULTISPECIES: hypothetical protein [Thermocrispum]|jgi:hypothetical protein|uniref:DUF983 domain-containing protein n=1 Tax=Thermocrispum agreste TaxID=37925 RepID=A0A2W4JPN3_9PSEU|nr:MULTISPECIES: hypothetical protein [Thermocrispum]PZN01015.1 MAG: DUF983 domain-containing protein [Thermocrispum agreste]